MKTSKTNAFTLIELLVVISIIAILAGIALPVFSTVMVRGAQTKALSNAKQIGLALKLYAMDNNDAFPNYKLLMGVPNTSQPFATGDNSNQAFAELFPDYLQNEQIFCTGGSAFSPTMADNQIDNPLPDAPSQTLKKGENTWAYVTGLGDTFNALFPLLADGFNDPVKHTYVADKTKIGGVWEGKKAVVLFVDCSATCTKTKAGTDASTRIMGGNPIDGGDLFSNTTTSTTGATWLGIPNVVLNPLN